MKSKVLNQLEQSLQPYQFFWDEWTNNGNCNLHSSEISLINYYRQNGFKLSFFNLLLDNERINAVKIVLRKLEIGFQTFKDFVIVNFLQTIINIALHQGYFTFLKSPISQLEIDLDLRATLLKLKTYNLQIAFSIYKPEDFNRKWLFDIIKEFQIINKKKECLILKTQQL